MHLVDKHFFPRNYDFFIVNDGIDRRSSMLRPPKSFRKYNKGQRSHRSSHGKELLISEDQGAKRQGVVSASKATNSDENDDEDEECSEQSSEEEINESDQDEESESEAIPSSTSMKTSSRSQFKPAALTPSSSVSANEPHDLDNLTKSMSSLRFVPRSVKFGRGKNKRLFVGR